MHLAEQILAQIETTLTGLATTGANVSRARAYNLATTPALTIAQGTDAVLDEGRNLTHVTRSLSVLITSHVKATTNLETELNQIRTEIFAALMADISQGLAFVITTELVEDQEPDIESTQEQPTARQQQIWRIIYRHSGTSTEALS